MNIYIWYFRVPYRCKHTNIYVLCKQKMDIAGQKLEEIIYFWHVEILFKKVPFYACNLMAASARSVCVINLWQNYWDM